MNFTRFWVMIGESVSAPVNCRGTVVMQRRESTFATIEAEITYLETIIRFLEFQLCRFYTRLQLLRTELKQNINHPET